MNSGYSLEGRTALITGATRGIGLAIARAFAGAGARVLVNSRKADAVDRTVAAIRDEGGIAEALAGNVSRPEELDVVANAALTRYDGPDILVNNAAANPVFGPFTDVSSEAFDKIIAVNLKAPFELARRFVPRMIERKRGAIINISSIGGLAPEPGLGIYSVSKAAIISLTKVMAIELGPHGIRANAICPGFIKTDFSATLWRNEELVDEVLARTPMKRLGEPNDVAHTALFLASDESKFCTGGVFVVDGGYRA
ncbi:MAG TPA: SDR family oxidoreductase [Gemmatimonadaceae bacterium]|jgi:NAD(P)-dependent dehydrogenase (short-subunit alcohol dehydrogenase family)